MLLVVAPTALLGLSCAPAAPCRAAAPRMAVKDIPGAPAAADEAQYLSDPAAFCRERLKRHGGIFVTGAFGGTVFVGGEAAIAALAGTAATPVADTNALCTPFARAAAAGAYGDYSADFNEECYSALFEWIPLYKETGGFSTFKFDDFIDKRVRKIVPSSRRLLFAATAPATLGRRLSELPASDSCATPAEWAKAYNEHAKAWRGSSGGGAGGMLGGLFGAFGGGGGGGASAPELESALKATAAGADALEQVRGSVEQTSALLTSMLAMAQAHPAWAARLAAEQKSALSGVGPEDEISAELLAQMPELHAFALETLRMAPPARPARLRLDAPLELEGGLSLPAGTLVAPEPFVGGFLASQHREPDSFEPERFLGETPEASPLGAAFGGPIGEGEAEAGKELALAFAKAGFVQAKRMFDLKLPVDRPLTASGYPLRALPENVEAFCDPGMYYELKRGVRKLKF